MGVDLFAGVGRCSCEYRWVGWRLAVYARVGVHVSMGGHVMGEWVRT